MVRAFCMSPSRTLGDRWRVEVVISRLDVDARKLELLVDEKELQPRRANWRPGPPRYERGFGALYAAHVTQANKGCDFDVLEAGAETPEPEIH